MSRAAKLVKLKKFKDLYSPEAVANRFAVLVQEHCKANNLTRRQLADQWQVNEDHLSQVIHGKPISIAMLVAAYRYSGFNMHYIMSGEGLQYVGGPVPALQKLHK